MGTSQDLVALIVPFSLPVLRTKPPSDETPSALAVINLLRRLWSVPSPLRPKTTSLARCGLVLLAPTAASPLVRPPDGSTVVEHRQWGHCRWWIGALGAGLGQTRPGGTTGQWMGYASRKENQEHHVRGGRGQQRMDLSRYVMYTPPRPDSYKDGRLSLSLSRS